MIVKVILPVIAVLFAVTVFVLLMAAAFEDTETFRAIDERIARLIKGDEDDD